jgi:hypothetical protein
METYRATHHPNDPLPNPHLCLAWNYTTIYTIAQSLGLKVFIDHLDTHDIAWFSYTKGGIVKAKRVPTAPRLERFAKELGLTEKPQWHDAGLPVQVCVDIHPSSLNFHAAVRIRLCFLSAAHLHIPCSSKSNSRSRA